MPLSFRRWEGDLKDIGNDHGMMWKFLTHNGPVFAPPYEPLPDNIKFRYAGAIMELNPATEEIASLYARLLKDGCTKIAIFNTNFLKVR